VPDLTLLLLKTTNNIKEFNPTNMFSASGTSSAFPIQWAELILCIAPDRDFNFRFPHDKLAEQGLK